MATSQDLDLQSTEIHKGLILERPTITIQSWPLQKNSNLGVLASREGLIYSTTPNLFFLDSSLGKFGVGIVHFLHDDDRLLELYSHN